MNLIDFCELPRTMAEVLDAGFTRDQIYNNVKQGKLINLTRRDAWGRITHNRPGLFQSIAILDGSLDDRHHGGREHIGNQAKHFDSRALVSAWGASS